MSSARPIEILMIEDNPGDARLAGVALADSRVPSRLTVVEDGMEGMAYLRRQGQYAGAPRPDLILLDLNLPCKNGHEVLQEIKQDPELLPIPVLVLSASDAEQDVRKSYMLRANCYLAKPAELEDYLALMKAIEDFWLRLVVLPRGA